MSDLGSGFLPSPEIQAILAEVATDSVDVIGVWDLDGTVVYANGVARLTFGVLPGPVGTAGHRPQGGPGFLDVFDGPSRSRYLDEVLPAVTSAGTWRGELTLVGDGELVMPVSALFTAHFGDDGQAERISLVARDISDLKARESQLRRLATHDLLTGLANRALWMEQVDHALARRRRYPGTVVVATIDLGGLATLERRIGTRAAEDLLVEASRRVRDAVRASDAVARLDADVFAVLYDQVADPADAAIIAGRLAEVMQTPFDSATTAEGEVTTVPFSIGAAAAGDRDDSAAILRRADDARAHAAHGAPPAWRVADVPRDNTGEAP